MTGHGYTEGCDFPGSQAAEWVDRPAPGSLIVDVVGLDGDDCVDICSPLSAIPGWVYTVPRSEIRPVGPVARALLRLKP